MSRTYINEFISSPHPIPSPSIPSIPLSLLPPKFMLFSSYNPLCLLNTAIMSMGNGLGFGKSLGAISWRKWLSNPFVCKHPGITHKCLYLWFSSAVKTFYRNQLSKCQFSCSQEKIKWYLIPLRKDWVRSLILKWQNK